MLIGRQESNLSYFPLATMPRLAIWLHVGGAIFSAPEEKIYESVGGNSLLNESQLVEI